MDKKLVIVFIMVVLLIVFVYISNNLIEVSSIKVTSKKIPREFNAYKIVHLSDLHNKSFGKNQEKLVEKVAKISPDLIVITGDIIDSRRYDEVPSLKLVNSIRKIAPVYYVPGNHEMRSGRLKELEQQLIENGAVVLRNESIVLKKGLGQIVIGGIDDPNSSNSNVKENKIVQNRINDAIKNHSKDKYKILLSHRPEKFSIYIRNNIDLIFSGHAHGGQVRLPFLGGIIAPQQGFFPKYTSGKYEEGGSTMIVSRGLGNSLAPLRVFNRPEIIVVQLIKD